MLDRNHVLGVVLAHSAAAKVVASHLPLWLRTCSKVVVFTPNEQGFHLPGADVFCAVDDGGAYSPHTSVRCRHALTYSLGLGYPYTMLLEYDAVTWGPIPDHAIPPHGGVAACRWPNEPVSPVPGKVFASPFYLHFPQLYTRLALELVVSAMEDMPADAEHGYTDRFVGLAVHRAGVPVKDWRAMGLCYSWENISRHEHRVVECIHAVANGALFSHGIKDEASLRRILEVAPWGRQP